MKIKIEDKELIIKYRNKKRFSEIYDKICENTMSINLNEIHIKYKIKREDNKIRIFGDKFIYHNYNNCKIVWNHKIMHTYLLHYLYSILIYQIMILMMNNL